MTVPLRVTGRAEARPVHLHPSAFDDIIVALRLELAELEEQSATLDLALRGLSAGSADDLAGRDLVDVHAARAHETLEAIRAALERVDNGTYGLCVGCARPIPVERLQAVPSAERCVACPPPRRLLV